MNQLMDRTPQRPTNPLGAVTGDVDVSSIMAAVHQTVAEAARAGAYEDPRLSRVERWNAAGFQGDSRFLRAYLSGLHHAVSVSLDPVGVRERRRCCRLLLSCGKRWLWKSLGFYSVRLWDQQNRVNGTLAASAAALEHALGDRLSRLSHRVGCDETENP